MTKEEKAIAYDKAIEKIKYVMEHGVSPTLSKEDLQDLFSELKESEDERIRKEIIDIIKSQKEQQCHIDGAVYDKMVAWLEKQTPAKFKDEKDERIIEVIKKVFEAKQKDNVVECLGVDVNDILTWLKKQKSVEWTQNDEENLLACKNALTAGQYAESISEWLEEKIKLPKSDSSETTRLKDTVANLKIMIVQSKGFNRNNRDKVLGLLDNLYNYFKKMEK